MMTRLLGRQNTFGAVFLTERNFSWVLKGQLLGSQQGTQALPGGLQGSVVEGGAVGFLAPEERSSKGSDAEGLNGHRIHHW